MNGKLLAFWVAASGCVAPAPAQEAAAEFAARVRATGRLDDARYRREPDGALAIWYTAGDAGGGEWLPLLESPAERYENLGALGLLALCCHGDADLLAMTDAAFHFAALGIDASDVGLRQFLAVPAPPFDGALGRAHLLDRLLAIDRLQQRNCRGAIAELMVIQRNDAAPSVLRARAATALQHLRGEPAPANVRVRLDPQQVRLPRASDVVIVVDHARLPDMRWVAALGRRLGALVTARTVEAVGGEISAAACNGAQRMSDLAAEAPFHVALRRGNVRLDQSLLALSLRNDARAPVVVTWNAAGAFEHEGWSAAAPAGRDAPADPPFPGTLTMGPTTLYASSDDTVHEPRPDRAAALLANGDGDCAVRVIVPQRSLVWAWLAPSRLPRANGAELRVTFGDPATIVLAVDTPDDDAAADWIAQATRLLADAVAAARAGLPADLAQQRDLAALLEHAAATTFAVENGDAIATLRVPGFTPARVAAIVEAASAHVF